MYLIFVCFKAKWVDFVRFINGNDVRFDLSWIHLTAALNMRPFCFCLLKTIIYVRIEKQDKKHNFQVVAFLFIVVFEYHSVD